MILSKEVEITITFGNIKYYTEKKYNPIIGNTILVRVEDLPPCSRYEILVKCDICGNEKMLSYAKYNKNISKYDIYSCSTKCSSFKNKLTCIEKYGVEHQLKSDIVKKKIKDTNNDRYGVDNVFQYVEVKEQIKKNNLEKFGVEYPQQNKEILEKSNQTNILRYGVKRPAMSKLITDKCTDTCKETLMGKFNNKYIDIIDVDYNIGFGSVTAKCDKGHIFDINLKTLYSRTINNIVQCTECNPITHKISGMELDLLDFITNNYDGNIITNSRNIISPYELDIYLPELKLGIEFNGNYWHSEVNKPNDYHKIKSDLCRNINIQLVHVYERDWVDKTEIVKSFLLNLINKDSEIKDFEIKVLTDNMVIKSFMDNNDLNGYTECDINIGLFVGDLLISLLSINYIGNIFHIISFCGKNKKQLLNYFIDNYGVKEINYSIDRSYSNMDELLDLGFKYISSTEPKLYISNNENIVYNSGDDIFLYQ